MSQTKAVSSAPFRHTAATSNANTTIPDKSLEIRLKRKATYQTKPGILEPWRSRNGSKEKKARRTQLQRACKGGVGRVRGQLAVQARAARALQAAQRTTPGRQTGPAHRGDADGLRPAAGHSDGRVREVQQACAGRADVLAQAPRPCSASTQHEVCAGR
jgi:hypothetical protein